MPSLRILIATGVLAVLASTGFASTLQLNFGAPVSIPGWNNITGGVGASPTGTLSDLVDSDGLARPIVFSTQARFNGVNLDGASTASPVNNLGIPDAVAASSLYGNTKPHTNTVAENPSFKLSGLNPTLVYTIKIYASRVGVVPATEKRTAIYTVKGINVVSGVLDASNNTSGFLTLENVRPSSSGNIVIDVKTAPDNTNSKGFTYLNALTITPSLTE